MSDSIRQVAARIRDLRQIAGVDASSLAADLGVTVEEYRRYEDGEVDFPISFLSGVAARFGVEMADLLSGESPKLRVYNVVRRGRGPGAERSQAYSYEALATNFAHKRAEPYLVTVKPADPGVPVHRNRHPGQEFNYLLEGTMKIIIDDHEITLHEGDSIYFDAAHDHGMKAMDGKPARFLAVIL